ncbi:MAG: amidase family protein, partial [Pseudomonadota bacterium]
TVEEVDLGWTHAALDAGLTYLEHLFGASLSVLLETHGDQLTTYARAFAEKGRDSKAVDFVHTLEVANTMYATLGPLLEKHNVLICPTTALPAVPADFDQSQDSVFINGKQVNPMLGWVMTSPFNTMSRCPVLTLPTGRASNGVPTSIQVVGRTYCDKDVFRAGMAFEEAAGRWFENAAKRPPL